MKKILQILLVAFIAVGFSISSASAKVDKGQKYYLKFFKKSIGKGDVFAKQYTQDEWKALFAGDGSKFITWATQKYSEPKFVKFITSEKFKKKYLKHIGDFCVAYASDSGNIPSC